MPKLGAALDFNQLEARNVTVHNLSGPPAAPVKGQCYFDTVSNTLLWWDGTVWQSARGGVYADATTSAKGIVQLANDLGGTAAAPAVVGLHLAADTAINHKLTTITDPTNPQDAATKNYVDAQGSYALSWKAPVRAATTVAITLSGTQTVDTVALNVGDRVMVKNQASQTANGVYIVQSGAWTRAPDLTTWAQFVQSVFFVMMAPGSVNGGTCWVFDQFPGGTIGSGNVYWDRYPAMVQVGSTSIVGRALDATSTLDTIRNPVAPVSLNGQNIQGLLDPVNPQDGATKNYVDGVAQGLAAKQPVFCATTPADGNLGLSGTAGTIDNISVVAGNRVLVKNQTNQAQNGIYVVAAGAWTRSADADAWGELVSAFVFVEEGTVNMDTGWVCTVDPGLTLGTNNVPWVQFSAAGVVTAGNGLTKSGNVMSALVDGSTIGFSGATLVVPANGITATQLANGAVVLGSADVTGTLPVVNGGTGQTTAKAARETGLGAGGYYNNNATHGAGTTITITQATHGLRAGRPIFVQVQDNTTGNVELPDVTVAANGDVTVTYAVALAANAKMVTLVG